MPDNLVRASRGLCFLAPPDQWLTRFEPARALTADERQAAVVAARPGYTAAGGVAVIPVKGLLVKDPWYFGETSTPAITAAVQAAAADQGIKTIVLAIDSPGGEVGGIAELSDAVWLARQAKTVIAAVQGQASSAAYWVAAQASKIYLRRLDVVGSIGVYTWLVDDSKWAEAQGIKVHLVSTGTYKGMDAPGQELSSEQVAEVQRLVDGYFAAFIADVVRGRGMTRAAVTALATGAVWMGAEAVKLGLADKVGEFAGGSSGTGPASARSETDQRLAASALALAEIDLAGLGQSSETPARKAE